MKLFVEVVRAKMENGLFICFYAACALYITISCLLVGCRSFRRMKRISPLITSLQKTPVCKAECQRTDADAKCEKSVTTPKPESAEKAASCVDVTQPFTPAAVLCEISECSTQSIREIEQEYVVVDPIPLEFPIFPGSETFLSQVATHESPTSEKSTAPSTLDAVPSATMFPKISSYLLNFYGDEKSSYSKQ